MNKDKDMLEFITNNKSHTVASIKQIESKIRNLEYDINSRETMYSTEQNNGVADKLKLLEECKDSLLFHKQSLVGIDEHIKQIEAENDIITPVNEKKLLGTHIDAWMEENAGVKEYKSVDEYMVDNEMEMLMIKAKREVEERLAEQARYDEVERMAEKEFGERGAEDVLETSPVYSRILKQVSKGLDKYGTEVKQEHYSIRGWHEHLQEELTDGLTYNELMLVKIENVIKTLEVGLRVNDPNLKDEHIRFALVQLTKGKN